MAEAIKIIAVLTGLVIYYLVFVRIAGRARSNNARKSRPLLDDAPPPPRKRRKTFGDLLQEFDEMVQANLPRPKADDLRPLRQQRVRLVDVPQLPEEMKMTSLIEPQPPLEPAAPVAKPPELKSREAPRPAYRLSNDNPPQAAGTLTINPVTELVQHPDQLRAAFILSEILKRKW